MELLDQLAAVERQYHELEAQLGDPEIAKSPSRYKDCAKRYSDLGELYRAVTEYREILASEDEARSVLAESGGDAELRALAEVEIKDAVARRERTEANLQRLLLPKDPNDEKNVVLEIRAGTGGEEAALFAMDLFRMYSRFAERQGWKVSTLSESYAEAG